jgi:hypothetical protein
VGVDRLVLRDPEQPGAQVVAAAELRVGAERRDPGLLERVVSLRDAGRRDQEAVHVGSVLFEESLKGGQVHTHRTSKRRRA